MKCRPRIVRASALTAFVLLSLGCGAEAPKAPPTKSWATPFFMKGIRTPAAVGAKEAQLPDESPVIGVVVKGKPRAYLISAMSNLSQHVINDVIGDNAVTVTYCDRSDHPRVFSAEGRDAPLDVDLAGWADKMILRAGAGLYWQESGEPIAPNAKGSFPYATIPHERTTWKAWKEAHSDTDVFVGVKAQVDE